MIYAYAVLVTIVLFGYVWKVHVPDRWNRKLENFFWS